MKIEQFEQEYSEEIGKIKQIEFARVIAPEFKIPTYKMFNTKALSFAFALPALAMLFGLFISTSSTNNQYAPEIAMLEDSNTRLINQIDTLNASDNSN